MESTLTAKLTGMESLLEGSSSFDRSTNHENSKNVNKSIAAPSGECFCDESLVEQESAILSSQVNINIARKRRVLIVGDGNCREARKILLDYTKSNFDVISFFKPNAPLEVTLDNIQQMSRGFDKRDLIIVLAGINNVLQGKPLKESFLVDLVSRVQHTRLCVVSVPNIINFEQRVKNFNDKLFRYFDALDRESVLYIDVTSVLIANNRREYVQYNKAEKRRILYYIYRTLLRELPSKIDSNFRNDKGFQVVS